MRAITLLGLAGMSRAGIAASIGQTTHSVRLYERGERFPGKQPYAAIVRLAESRGLQLMARDFIENGDTEAA